LLKNGNQDNAILIYLEQKLPEAALHGRSREEAISDIASVLKFNEWICEKVLIAKEKIRNDFRPYCI
jgi:hypothetical protein